MRLIKWYWRHFRRAYGCETTWPWQKAHWQGFWSRPPETRQQYWQRTGSTFITIIGIGVINIVLMLLAVTVVLALHFLGF